MTFKSITITQSGDPEWRGRVDPDPFKPKSHYCMMVFLIIGLLIIIAIGIWIGIDLKKQGDDQDLVETPKSEATTTTAKLRTETTTDTTTTTTTTTTITTAATTTRLPRSTTMSDSRVLLELKQAMGDPARIKRSNFTNWDMRTTVDNLYVATPNSYIEIQALVKAAKRNGLRIRAIGSGMSYSNLFPDAGHIMLDMSSFIYRRDGQRYALNNSFVEFQFPTVSVAAGVSQGDLVHFMVDNNVQLNSMGSSFGISIGGAISTGTYGSAPNESTMSDFVVGLEYVDSEGELRNASISTPEDIQRIRCCLGLCGIIFDITLKVEPMRMARLIQGFNSGFESVQNNTFLSEGLEYSGFELFFAPLSSLTKIDWESYERTGDLPKTYDPWMDQWWWRKIEDVSAAEPKERRRRRRSVTNFPLLDGSLLDETFSNFTNITIIEPSIPYTLLEHKWAYDYVVMMAEATKPTDAIPAPFLDFAVHVNESLLSNTYSFNFLIPENSELTTLKRAFGITFELAKPYLARGKQPFLTIETRWIKPSPACVLCPGAFKNTSRVLTFEPVGGPSKPEYFMFMTDLLSKLRLEWPEVRLHWAKFYDDVTGVNELIKYTMTKQLQDLYDTANNVAFRDLFTTDLLQEFVN